MDEHRWEKVTTELDGKTERMRVEGGYIYRTILRLNPYANTKSPTITVSMVFVPVDFATMKTVALADD